MIFLRKFFGDVTSVPDFPVPLVVTPIIVAGSLVLEYPGSIFLIALAVAGPRTSQLEKRASRSASRQPLTRGKIGLLCFWDWHSHGNKVGAPGREMSQTDHEVKSKPLRRLPGL